MKTVLVFRASDIFIRDVVTTRLEQNGIKTFGSDTSVNVIYPNTPNLYLSGASAVIDGYRILVSEDDVELAKRLIREIEIEYQIGIVKSVVEKSMSSADELAAIEEGYVRRFYFSALFGIFMPILPPLFAIYYFVKALKAGKSFSVLKAGVSVVLVAWNIIYSYYILNSAYEIIIQ